MSNIGEELSFRKSKSKCVSPSSKAINCVNNRKYSNYEKNKVDKNKLKSEFKL